MGSIYYSALVGSIFAILHRWKRKYSEIASRAETRNRRIEEDAGRIHAQDSHNGRDQLKQSGMPSVEKTGCRVLDWPSSALNAPILRLP